MSTKTGFLPSISEVIKSHKHFRVKSNASIRSVFNTNISNQASDTIESNTNIKRSAFESSPNILMPIPTENKDSPMRHKRWPSAEAFLKKEKRHDIFKDSN